MGIGGPLGGWVSDRYGWRTSFLGSSRLRLQVPPLPASQMMTLPHSSIATLLRLLQPHSEIPSLPCPWQDPHASPNPSPNRLPRFSSPMWPREFRALRPELVVQSRHPLDRPSRLGMHRWNNWGLLCLHGGRDLDGRRARYGTVVAQEARAAACWNQLTAGADVQLRRHVFLSPSL